MHKKNIILISLKESFSLVIKNKLFFAMLFILQIIFFGIFFAISLNYQTKILETAKEMFVSMSQQNPDDVEISSRILQQKDIFSEQASLTKNFSEIIRNFRFYLIYTFILLVILTSIVWTLTNKLIYKNNSTQFFNIFFKILIVSVFYLGLIFVFFFSLLNISLIEAASLLTGLFMKYVPFVIFSIILFYFMFISLPLLHKTKLNSIVQETLSIGIKKAHYVFFAYFINLLLLIIPFYLLFYFIETNFFIVVLSMLMLIFSFVFGRIFIINVVDKLRSG